MQLTFFVLTLIIFFQATATNSFPSSVLEVQAWKANSNLFKVIHIEIKHNDRA